MEGIEVGRAGDWPLSLGLDLGLSRRPFSEVGVQDQQKVNGGSQGAEVKFPE